MFFFNSNLYNVYVNTNLCYKVCQWLAAGLWFSFTFMLWLLLSILDIHFMMHLTRSLKWFGNIKNTESTKIGAKRTINLQHMVFKKALFKIIFLNVTHNYLAEDIHYNVWFNPLCFHFWIRTINLLSAWYLNKQVLKMFLWTQ